MCRRARCCYSSLLQQMPLEPTTEPVLCSSVAQLPREPSGERKRSGRAIDAQEKPPSNGEGGISFSQVEATQRTNAGMQLRMQDRLNIQTGLVSSAASQQSFDLLLSQRCRSLWFFVSITVSLCCLGSHTLSGSVMAN